MRASSTELLDATLLHEVETRALPGANAEIFEDGLSVWRGAAGVVDRDTGDGIPSGATFPIYFFEALFTGTLLDRQGLAEMLQLVPIPGHYPPAVTPSYGLGIMADPRGALGAKYGHGGGGPGWNCGRLTCPIAPAGVSPSWCCATTTTTTRTPSRAL